MNPFLLPKSYLSLAYSYVVPNYFSRTKPVLPLADVSLLTFLLILISHMGQEEYRKRTLQVLWLQLAPINNDFQNDSIVCDRWCRLFAENSEGDLVWVLLYFLFYDRKSFRLALVQQNSFETLMTNGLKRLYEQFDGGTTSWEFVQIFLSILLMLSEESDFIKNSRSIVSE